MFWIKLSLFFDILLPCCADIGRDTYLAGLFKTNVQAPSNQTEMISKSRLLLWNSLRPFRITNKCFDKSIRYNYLHDHTVQHRHGLFAKTNNSFYLAIGPADQTADVVLTNTILNGNIKCQIKQGTVLVNCELDVNHLEIGSDCFISDVKWVSRAVFDDRVDCLLIGFKF